MGQPVPTQIKETVPELAAKADLLLWADRIVKGDPRRVANFGGPAMAMPSAPEVSAALSVSQDKLTNQP